MLHFISIGQSVTLTVTAETYVHIQEPDYQSSSIPIEVCASAQIAQPLRRLVVFDYHWTRMTTAGHYRDFSLPLNQPFSIRPNSTSLNSCFDIMIRGDDNVEIIDKQLVIIIEPISAMDRVNFTANNTISISIEDNPSE